MIKISQLSRNSVNVIVNKSWVVACFQSNDTTKIAHDFFTFKKIIDIFEF